LALCLKTEAWLPDFSWHNIPKRLKVYLLAIQYAKQGDQIFRPMSDCLIRAFFENYRSSPRFCSTLWSIDYVIILRRKKWLGYILGDIF
jgi:hypothetical protein